MRMTWVCPYCENTYPDSGIGLPPEADADDKTHCRVCSVPPMELEALVEEWRELADSETTGEWTEHVFARCADELEELIADD